MDHRYGDDLARSVHNHLVPPDVSTRACSLLSSTLLRDSQLRIEVIKGKSVVMKEQMCRAKLMWEVGSAKFKRSLTWTIAAKSAKAGKEMVVDLDGLRAITPCHKFPLEASAAFSVHMKKKVYHCVADNERDMMGWVAGIQAAVEESRVQEGPPLLYHVSIIDSPAGHAHGECLMEFHPRWQPHSLVFRSPLSQVVVYGADIPTVVTFGYSARTSHLWIKLADHSQTVLRVNGVTAAHVARVLRSHMEESSGELEVNDQLASTDRMTFTVPGSSKTSSETPGSVLHGAQGGREKKGLGRGRYFSEIQSVPEDLQRSLSKSEDGQYERMSGLPYGPQRQNALDVADQGSLLYEEMSELAGRVPSTDQLKCSEAAVEAMYDNSKPQPPSVQECAGEYDHLVAPHTRQSRPTTVLPVAGNRRRSPSISPVRYDHLFRHLDTDGTVLRPQQHADEGEGDSTNFQRVGGFRHPSGTAISDVDSTDSRVNYKQRLSMRGLSQHSQSDEIGAWRAIAADVEDACYKIEDLYENGGEQTSRSSRQSDAYEVAFNEPPSTPSVVSHRTSGYEVSDDVVANRWSRSSNPPITSGYEVTEILETKPGYGDNDIYEEAVENDLHAASHSAMSSIDSQALYEVAVGESPPCQTHAAGNHDVVRSTSSQESANLYEVAFGEPALTSSHTSLPDQDPRGVYELAFDEPPPPPISSTLDSSGGEGKGALKRRSRSVTKIAMVSLPTFTEPEENRVPTSPRHRYPLPPPLPGGIVRRQPLPSKPLPPHPSSLKPSSHRPHVPAGRRHSHRTESETDQVHVHFLSTMGPSRLGDPFKSNLMRARSDSNLSNKDDKELQLSLTESAHHGSATFSDCDEDYVLLDVIRSKSPLELHDFRIVNGGERRLKDWSPAVTPETPALSPSPGATQPPPLPPLPSSMTSATESNKTALVPPPLPPQPAGTVPVSECTTSVPQTLALLPQPPGQLTPPVPKPRHKKSPQPRSVVHTIPSLPLTKVISSRATHSLPSPTQQGGYTRLGHKPARPPPPPKPQRTTNKALANTSSSQRPPTEHGALRTAASEPALQSVAAKAQFLEAHLGGMLRVSPGPVQSSRPVAHHFKGS